MGPMDQWDYMGNGVQGSWGYTAQCRHDGHMGYRGMGQHGQWELQGYGPHRQWDIWAMGYRGMGQHGQWGTGVLCGWQGVWVTMDNGTHGQWGNRGMGHIITNGVQMVWTLYGHMGYYGYGAHVSIGYKQLGACPCNGLQAQVMYSLNVFTQRCQMSKKSNSLLDGGGSQKKKKLTQWGSHILTSI